jgi:asparagine synthase (glutamine-hydrolysing)
MSGICGYYGKNVSSSLLPMQILKHRGLDDDGVVTKDHYKFGHTRLAIIDVEGGRQPMANQDGSLCIVFDGEIYNYRLLRAGLRRKHTFKTTSDVEVIMHLFEEEGPAGLAKLDGMFALAIASPQGLVIARDPLGIKPLYFQENHSYFYFASEIKAFIQNQDPIREFPPGQIFNRAFGAESGGYQKYFEMPEDYDTNLDWEISLGELRHRLKKAVQKRLAPDMPLGCFLSGGLGSSLITALSKEEMEELHTFSVGMAENSGRYYTQLAAGHLKTIHHEYILTPKEIWDCLPEIIYYLESFDQSLVRNAVANFFLAKLAAAEVKVVLTGEGADELFAGCVDLNCFQDWDRLREGLRQITLQMHNTNLQRLDRMTMAHGLEARVPFLDRELVTWALKHPPVFNKNIAGGAAKWLLCEAFRREGLLPDEMMDRRNEKLAEGTGIAPVLAALTEDKVPEGSYQAELSRGTPLRSREEYYYFQIFVAYFGRGQVMDLVGRSKS